MTLYKFIAYYLISGMLSPFIMIGLLRTQGDYYAKSVLDFATGKSDKNEDVGTLFKIIFVLIHPICYMIFYSLIKAYADAPNYGARTFEEYLELKEKYESVKRHKR